ncbi:hypothetical protein [Pontibacter chitinilyticus]|uniref:hypothetical protein n=1 Tax=Pontibacter chitinilyticus TaxID=2674989 RepID=UPI00321ADF8A
MNKRILGSACACLFSCPALRAQDLSQSSSAPAGLQDTLTTAVPRPRHELYAAYGVLSFPAWMEALSTIFRPAITVFEGMGRCRWDTTTC